MNDRQTESGEEKTEETTTRFAAGSGLAELAAPAVRSHCNATPRSKPHANSRSSSGRPQTARSQRAFRPPRPNRTEIAASIRNGRPQRRKTGRKQRKEGKQPPPSSIHRSIDP